MLIDTNCHFIREHVNGNSTKLIYKSTDAMTADVLEKSLSEQNIELDREKVLGESRFLSGGKNLSEVISSFISCSL